MQAKQHHSHHNRPDTHCTSLIIISQGPPMHGTAPSPACIVRPGPRCIVPTAATSHLHTLQARIRGLELHDPDHTAPELYSRLLSDKQLLARR